MIRRSARIARTGYLIVIELPAGLWPYRTRHSGPALVVTRRTGSHSRVTCTPPPFPVVLSDVRPLRTPHAPRRDGASLRYPDSARHRAALQHRAESDATSRPTSEGRHARARRDALESGAALGDGQVDCLQD